LGPSTVSLVLVRRAFTLKTINLETIGELFKTFFESPLAEPRVLAIREAIIGEFTQIKKFDRFHDKVMFVMDASERKPLAQKLVNIVARNLLDYDLPSGRFKRPEILQSPPPDLVGSVLREFEKETLVPVPGASFTSLPQQTLTTSVDKIASMKELRETAIALRGAKAGTFMDLLLVVGARSFPLSIYIPLTCNTGP
jgi:hypothetical protein